MLNETEFYPLERHIDRSVERTGRSVSLPLNSIVGLDVLVDEEGYARSIFSSDDPPCKIDNLSDALDWLSKPDPRTLFTADSRFLDPLLKWAGPAILEGVSKLHEGYPIALGNLRVHYLDSGYIRITRSNRIVKKIRCLEPFFHMSRMLGEEDCFSTKEKACRLVSSLDNYRMPQGDLKSPGGVLQTYITRSGIACRARSRVPDEALDMASNCYHTHLTVAVRAGYFPKAWDYDISSAFPTQTARLLSCDPTNGEWRQTKDYQPNASYGFCRVICKQYAFLSPLLFRYYCQPQETGRIRRHQRGYAGSWEGWLTKREIDFLRYYSVGEVEILDGWWFFAEHDFRPFEKSMQDFFDARDTASSVGDKFMSNLCKLVGLTTQGKCLSNYLQYGQRIGGYMRNPVYAADITSATRVQLGEFFIQHEDSVLHVAVDGVTLDKKVDVPGGRGQFRLESHPQGEECVVAADGEYWIASRQSILQKATLEKYARDTKYPCKAKLRRYTLGEAAIKKVAFEEVGLPNRSAPWFDVNEQLYKADRLFTVRPQQCSDLLTEQYTSVPRMI